MNPLNAIPIRFDEETGCHLIVGRAATQDGHIQVRVGEKLKYAHRLNYENVHGPIPEGCVVRHSCDKPNCINPYHLVLGTHQDNVADRVARGRSAHGVGHGRAKLTEEDVRYVLRNGHKSAYALSRELGVDPRTISKITEGKTWRHIPR